MRRFTIYSICCLWSLLGTSFLAASPQGKEDEKRILIINSYGKQILWTQTLNNSLENQIYEKHPHWMVHSDNLKTESATYINAAAFTLRSILWGYAEQTQTKVDATSPHTTSFFVQDDIPDAIVWIGEEGFLHFHLYSFSWGKWGQIPMVLCAVNDSVAAGWRPERSFNFDTQYKIQEYTLFKKKLNYTGVNVALPIRQNLELIHQLMPDLEELIWVDNDYYRSMRNRLEVEKILKEVMPDVKYAKMIDNRMNTDSIYNVMLEPVAKRAFLTYGWNISGLHSKRSDAQIDSLFTYSSTVPLFSLTKRDFEKDSYWIGGCYLDNAIIVNKTVALLEQVLRGDSAGTIPFERVTEGHILLNRTAIERYGLSKEADALHNVTYTHIPPFFFRQYEQPVLIAVLIIALVLCLSLIARRWSKYNKQLQTDSTRYKRLYDKLQVIYENCSMDFALYNESGQRLLRIVNGIVTETGKKENDLFAENLFANPCLSEEQQNQIRTRQVVNCEIALDAYGKLSRSNFAEQTFYQLIVKPLFNVNYHASSFVAIAINLTPIIQVRKGKEHFENLFHSASDLSQVGVLFYDLNTAVGTATDSWGANMNETFQSGTFPTYESVIPEDREVLLQYQKKVRAGMVLSPLCRDIQVNGNNGQLHWIRQHQYFLPNPDRLVELNLNIDRQKQSEHSLEEAKKKAEESNEETGLFLNSISHEVRTPLNAIVGFSAVLSSTDEESDGNQEFTPIIMRSTHLLEALITNILDLSALDSGAVKFNYTKVNILYLYHEMEAYIRNNLYHRPIQVIGDLPECEEERMIVTDKEYLGVLCHNLISNAVKFTETGSFTLGFRREEQRAYFYITDTGCGISPEDQKRIFNRFVKLNVYMLGTGLGLSLCKSIVEHLGGEIGVISQLGKGSTFWFTLPLKKI